MTRRVIPAADRTEAEAIAARVDAAYGYPRCERLAGNVTNVGGGRHVATCPCTRADQPKTACLLATRAEALPFKRLDRSWALPVREELPVTVAALTAPERARVVTIASNDQERPVGW